MSLGLVKVNCNNFFTIITLKIVDFYLPKFYPKTVPQCVTANYIALILLVQAYTAKVNPNNCPGIR
jgi:hypothetical protein